MRIGYVGIGKGNGICGAITSSTRLGSSDDSPVWGAFSPTLLSDLVYRKYYGYADGYSMEKVEKGYEKELNIAGTAKEDIAIEVISEDTTYLKVVTGEEKVTKVYLDNPDKVDLEKVEAEYNNGLLKLFVPFKEVKPIKVKIK